MSFKRSLSFVIFIMLVSQILGGSAIPPGDQLERARAFTRAIEFDYLAWTLDALGVKLGQVALGVPSYLPADTRPELVLEYLDLVRRIQGAEAQLSDIYADPDVSDPEAASAALRQEILDLRARRALLEPLAESLLQNQVSRLVAELGLVLAGQPFPPVLYHTTPPPYALVISPRQVIRQDAQISISPDLTVDQQDALERQVDQALEVSSLVVGIGGIGLYPTMVMQTTDVNWLAEVVAHEWVHNYLTLRPLGIYYLDSPELRTMNETAASIAGKEIGRALVALFYPEYLPPPPPPAEPVPASDQDVEPPPPPVFDYRAEMHLTRVNADRLLADGEIEQAELYMELRRRFFWDNGYHIRKLNQAYFAFHGAYADQPGGAAGEDPVGSAVRALRAKTPSLADFLDRISWMWSFEQLQRAVREE